MPENRADMSVTREVKAQLFEAWMNRYHFVSWAGTSEEQRRSISECVALFMEGFK